MPPRCVSLEGRRSTISIDLRISGWSVRKALGDQLDIRCFRHEQRRPLIAPNIAPFWRDDSETLIDHRVNMSAYPEGRELRQIVTHWSVNVKPISLYESHKSPRDLR